MHWITSSVKPDFLLPDQVYFALLDIVYFKQAVTESCDIAIFTSQHGVVDCNFGQAFVVGQKTANKLNKPNVVVFSNVAELKNALLNIVGKKIVYFRGRDVTDSLDFLMQNNNFISKIVYEANGVDNLSNEIVDLLQNDKITKITVNSARSYDIFKALMGKYGLCTPLPIFDQPLSLKRRGLSIVKKLRP